eukprot:TRINITY_DN2121_c0_g1_i3.p1 TRINITY_DN2121_c0_g1~~TRINITY_DN2121_c0_g1_i3.p1  ORF type:complete len:229 (-),score=26.49 TRINITY_DN2121_c0_g1_i3:73-759(-)
MCIRDRYQRRVRVGKMKQIICVLLVAVSIICCSGERPNKCPDKRYPPADPSLCPQSCDLNCTQGCIYDYCDLTDSKRSCTPRCECFGDADCPDSQWCKPILTSGAGLAACVNYQQDGDSCGGFVMPWAMTKCGPTSECTDSQPMISDAPGKCRRICKETSECPKGFYCSNAEGSNSYCRANGSCNTTADCNNPENPCTDPTKCFCQAWDNAYGNYFCVNNECQQNCSI